MATAHACRHCLIMPVRLTATVENQVEFDRTFTRFVSQLTDWREIWPAVIVELRNIMREQFAAQGTGRRGRWPQLSARYAAQKRKKYPGLPILQRTRRLVSSLTTNTVNTIIIATAKTLTFGSSLPYGRFHQTGTRRMPARVIFDLNEQQKARLMKAVQRQLLTVGNNRREAFIVTNSTI